MSSLGDMWDNMWNEAGETESSKNYGFTFYEFLWKLLKIVGIIFVLFILFIVIILVLEHYNSPILDWLTKYM